MGAAAGYEVHLVLNEPRLAGGNLLLDELAGAQLHWVPAGWESLDRGVAGVAEALAAAGHAPYAIPIGGSTPLGATAFADAYDELLGQLDAAGEHPAWIVHASSSGGTQAGLIAGHVLAGRRGPRIVGIDVTKGTLRLVSSVPELAVAVLGSRDPDAVLEGADIIVRDPLGIDYGDADPRVADAIAIGLRTAGILCDPVYSGRALFSVAALARELGGGVVFWHTGGAPAVFAEPYAASFRALHARKHGDPRLPGIPVMPARAGD
jgi:L-cysteate sulfo-lyase